MSTMNEANIFKPTKPIAPTEITVINFIIDWKSF